MNKAFVIYNPQSGRRRGLREQKVRQAAEVLRSAGVDVAVAPTQCAGSAGEQVRAAIAEGCDTVIACGGDGTVHEVLQGVAGTDASLGLIPLGTGNALAYDLGLPSDLAEAARVLKPGAKSRLCTSSSLIASPSS